MNRSEEREPEPRHLFALLLDAFLYPLRGEGKWLLLVGAVFFWAASFLAIVPILGFLVGLFLIGYIAAFMMKIIGASAKGDSDMPGWPEFTDVLEDIVRPLFLVVVTLIFCFLPVIVGLAGVAFADWEVAPSFWIAAVCGGFLYFPMALLAVALTESLVGLNPILVIPSILKVWLDYLVVCVVQGIVVGLAYVTPRVPVPVIGPILGTFASLYFLAVEMRAVGFLYFSNREKLAWF